NRFAPNRFGRCDKIADQFKVERVVLNALLKSGGEAALNSGIVFGEADPPTARSSSVAFSTHSVFVSIRESFFSTRLAAKTCGDVPFPGQRFARVGRRVVDLRLQRASVAAPTCDSSPAIANPEL